MTWPWKDLKLNFPDKTAAPKYHNVGIMTATSLSLAERLM